MIKDQLESTGLFKVNLQSTEWVQYCKDRITDVYPVYQLGWFPDYSDADNYLTPFFLTGSNFLANHYDNPAVNDADHQAGQHHGQGRADRSSSSRSRTTRPRTCRRVPLLQGAQVAVAGTGRARAPDTLDASFKFRYGALPRADRDRAADQPAAG